MTGTEPSPGSDGLSGRSVAAVALECLSNTITSLMAYNTRLMELLLAQATRNGALPVGPTGPVEPIVRRTSPPILNLEEADAPLGVDIGEVRAGILGGPPGLIGRFNHASEPEQPVANS